MGGLGNQLFQYAFGQRLAANGIEVCYDLENGFRYDPYMRAYSLDPFDLEVCRSSLEDMPMGMSWRPPFHRIPKCFWSLYPESRRRVFYEKSPFRYDPAAVEVNGKHQYFSGYWQNPAYLNPVEQTLRKKLRLRNESTAFRNLSEEMRQSPSVSIHVRQYNDIDRKGRVIARARLAHGVCGADYYARALEHITVKSGLTAYVFTDSIKWCKEHLFLKIPCQYIADIGTFSDAEEMMLMASCRHHVISNSSFSWWGAWLGDNPQKAVVAPLVWNKSYAGDQTDICPGSWIRL